MSLRFEFDIRWALKSFEGFRTNENWWFRAFEIEALCAPHANDDIAPICREAYSIHECMTL